MIRLRHSLRALARPSRLIRNVPSSRAITNYFVFSEKGNDSNGSGPHQQHFAQPPPDPEHQKAGRRTQFIALATLASAYIAFKLYTWHNFPPEVANKLREGLRAEIDGNGKGFKDYNMALGKYLEALKAADEMDMDPISDEYTGLQIKICEMYEKLGMLDEARLMYREIGVSYVQALSARTVPNSLRAHIIQRDLRVALKTAMNESVKDPNLAKLGLLIHFKVAQAEVASKSPQLKAMIESQEPRTELSLGIDINESSDKSRHPKDAWQPFRDELFNARDMYVALCLATGDLGHALQTKLATTEWMAAAGCDLSQLLMSFYNVGSIFYIQAEELEVRELAQVGKAAEDSKRLANDSIKNSAACFDAILEVVNKLPGSKRRDHDVSEVQAMSIYGLGVISLHKGDLVKASDLLREARLRAKGIGLNDLMDSAEMELKKLERIVKEQKEGKKADHRFESPRMDVLLLKKDYQDSDD